LSQQVAVDSRRRNPRLTSIYKRPCDWFSPTDCAIDNAIDNEVIGDGTALKREAGSLITVGGKAEKPPPDDHPLPLSVE